MIRADAAFEGNVALLRWAREQDPPFKYIHFSPPGLFAKYGCQRL